MSLEVNLFIEFNRLINSIVIYSTLLDYKKELDLDIIYVWFFVFSFVCKNVN